MAGERLEHALKRYRKRYRAGDRSERSGVLDEFCELTGYHRKYAISLLNNVNDEPLQTSSERSSIWTDETRLVDDFHTRNEPVSESVQSMTGRIDSIDPLEAPHEAHSG